jgi:hypothetical protein
MSFRFQELILTQKFLFYLFIFILKPCNSLMIYHTLQNELGRRWPPPWPPPHPRRSTISSILRSLSSNPKRPLSNMTTDMLCFNAPIIKKHCHTVREYQAFSLSFDLVPLPPPPPPVSKLFSFSVFLCGVAGRAY